MEEMEEIAQVWQWTYSHSVTITPPLPRISIPNFSLPHLYLLLAHDQYSKDR